MRNQDLQDKLNYLNMLAYAFLHVRSDGAVHFSDSYIDLSRQDNFFCQLYKTICTDSYNRYHPGLGNFHVFSQLKIKRVP